MMSPLINFNNITTICHSPLIQTMPTHPLETPSFPPDFKQTKTKLAIGIKMAEEDIANTFCCSLSLLSSLFSPRDELKQNASHVKSWQ